MSNTKSELNPRTQDYEFGGPLGSLFIMISLPATVFCLHCMSSKDYSLTLSNFHLAYDVVINEIDGFGSYFSLEAILVIVKWFSITVFLERVLFAPKGKGVELRNGKTLEYRLNGHLSFWVILFALAFGNVQLDATWDIVGVNSFNLSFLYDSYLQLALGAMIFSGVLSVFLYIFSFKKGALLALGGNSGNPIFDFFIGRELNPRIGSFDLKEFCELRPGLIGWALLNFACCQKQFELTGVISKELAMVSTMQGLYVWDALYHEKAILTTMDITSDGFGFMLAFGDLVWVPFTYSLQARFLVEAGTSLPLPLFLFVTALNLFGYYIFRGANSEKDLFRSSPDSEDAAYLKYMKTESGRKLIISSWWGMARKINYTGDWLMGISWSLYTGFVTPVTYFYPIYFAILLVHRAYRDNHMCAVKYGKDWEKYKAHVPYIFFPGIL